VRLIVRSGLMDEGARPAGELRAPRHRAIALDAACEAMTLLKNDGGLLPLSRELRTVALIGPNAARPMLQGGGSSQVVTDAVRTLGEGLRDFLGPGVTVVEAQGCDNDGVPPPADRRQFSPTEARDAEGLRAAYFAGPDFAGEPTSAGVERHLVRWVAGNMAAAKRPPYGSFRWSGWFWPAVTGEYEFGLRATGAGHLSLDGAPLATPATEANADRLDVMGSLVPRRLATVTLEAGRGYRIQLDYVPERPDRDYVAIGVRPPAEPMARAVEAAKAADAVILVLGSGSLTEAEGYDRPDMKLPGAQDELARAVLATNPNTVVVMNTGSPFELPWIDAAAAVLQMWLPGETGPDALPAVLFGDRGPGGRLPVSFPRTFGDHPTHALSPDPRVCDYAEGLNVGYRGYDAAGTQPLFPFGHGLAYTDFVYADLQAPAAVRAGASVAVSVAITNTGARPGAEVVQLYVAPHAPRLPRPPKELKAFAKAALGPGETRRVTLDLEPNAFACWDVDAGGWVVDPGDYELRVGRSAGDIRLTATVRIEGGER
jgi:beta-glucosidase